MLDANDLVKAMSIIVKLSYIYIVVSHQAACIVSNGCLGGGSFFLDDPCNLWVNDPSVFLEAPYSESVF